MTHELKTWPEQFQAILEGRKTCEVRKDDRGFQVGDKLLLREWVDTTSNAGFRKRYYTDRELTVQITHITRGFGLPEDIVCLSIKTYSAPEVKPKDEQCLNWE